MQPVSLSTADRKSECIDFYLTQHNQLLNKFLTFSQDKKSDLILADQELIINFIPRVEWEQYQVRNLKPNRDLNSLRDYDLLKILGTGGFSLVLLGNCLLSNIIGLVRRRVNGKLFAMKVISKKHIVDTDKVEQIISERKIFSMLNHPFIVQLHSAFTSVY